MIMTQYYGDIYDDDDDDDMLTCIEVLSGSGAEFAELKAPSRSRQACLNIIVMMRRMMRMMMMMMMMTNTMIMIMTIN